MKKFAAILLACAMVFAVALTAGANSFRQTIDVLFGINLNVNGETFIPRDVTGKEVPVFLYEGTTYVPIRAISELYGANVGWDGTTDTVSITYTDYKSMYDDLYSRHLDILGQMVDLVADNLILKQQLQEYEAASGEIATGIAFPLHLFSNDGKTYLGKCVTDEWDRDGIYYRLIGDYSSTVALNSIWNTVGTYGSSVSDQSAFNNIAQHPPIIVDNNGQFVAYLTTNEWLSPRWSITELRMFLEQNGQ